MYKDAARFFKQCVYANISGLCIAMLCVQVGTACVSTTVYVNKSVQLNISEQIWVDVHTEQCMRRYCGGKPRVYDEL